MTKRKFIDFMAMYGDAQIQLHGGHCFMGTLDLSNTYIKSKIKVKPNKKPSEVYVWDWTNNRLITLQPKVVKSTTPLSSILGNH